MQYTKSVKMLIIGLVLNTYTSVYLQMRKAELFPPTSFNYY